MDFMGFLESYQTEPTTYLLVLFIYTVAASVFLPVPVEIALLSGAAPFPVTAVVLGAGKAAGSIVVFIIGAKIEEKIRNWIRWGWFNWLVDKSESFVRKYGYYALYVLLSIPFMPDTIPLYLFSLLNKEGEIFTKKGFALTNFLAGITRAVIFLVLFEFAGL